MDANNIITHTLSEFFTKNGINHRGLDGTVVQNDKAEIVFQHSSEFGSVVDSDAVKLSVCGDPKRDIDKIFKTLVKFAVSHIPELDPYNFSQVRFDIDRLVTNHVNGRIDTDITMPSMGISCDDRFVIMEDDIVLQVVIHDGIMRKIDMKKSRMLGYIVSRFKIFNQYKFNNVVECYGIHPNVNPSTKRLCPRMNLDDREVSLELMLELKTVLSVANLDECFNKSIHLSRLEPLF